MVSFRVPVRISTVAEGGRALGGGDRRMIDDTRELRNYLSAFFVPVTRGGGMRVAVTGTEDGRLRPVG